MSKSSKDTESKKLVFFYLEETELVIEIASQSSQGILQKSPIQSTYLLSKYSRTEKRERHKKTQERVATQFV